MTTDKVRIINKKGETRFVAPHIAKDKTLMKNYGYRVEDINFKEENGGSLIERIERVDNGDGTIKRTLLFKDSGNLPESNVDDLDFQNLTENVIQVEKIKGKPGRKPNLNK